MSKLPVNEYFSVTERWTIATGEKEVQAVAFSPDATLIASGCADAKIKIWDVLSGDLLHVLEGHQGGVETLDFAAQGKLLLSASEDCTLRFWDLESGKVHELKCDFQAITLASNNDGSLMVTGFNDGSISIWDLQKRTAIRSWTGHSSEINSVAFGPNDTVISGSSDGTVKTWNADTGESKASFFADDKQNPVDAVAINASGDLLASIANQVIKIWDVDGNHKSTLTSQLDSSGRLIFHPTREILISGIFWENPLTLWSVTNPGEHQLIGSNRSLSFYWVNDVAISRDGRYVACGGLDKMSAQGDLGIWSLKDLSS